MLHLYPAVLNIKGSQSSFTNAILRYMCFWIIVINAMQQIRQLRHLGLKDGLKVSNTAAVSVRTRTRFSPSSHSAVLCKQVFSQPCLAAVVNTEGFHWLQQHWWGSSNLVSPSTHPCPPQAAFVASADNTLLVTFLILPGAHRNKDPKHTPQHNSMMGQTQRWSEISLLHWVSLGSLGN